MLLFSFIFSVKMVTPKFTNFDKFLMSADMTAVTINSNKIVLNDIKDN